MKTYFKNITIFTLLALVLASCTKEKLLKADPDIMDPYTRADNASSPADHQIFLIYQSTHVPILYKDTVSKKPLTMVALNYNLSGPSSALRLRYLTDPGDILAGVNFVQNEVLPHLTKSVKPFSVLLMDSIVTKKANSSYQLVDYALCGYEGLSALAVGNVRQIAQMTPDSLKSYRAYVLAAMLQTKLTSILYTPLLNNFYAVSANNYFIQLSGSQVLEDLGLLSNSPGPFYYTTGSSDDITNYLRHYLTMGSAGMLTQYAAYPLVVSKVKYLQQALITLGYVE